MTKRNPVHANESTLNQTPNHAFFFRFALRVRRRRRPRQPSFPRECPLKREGAATAISNSSARAPATLGWWAPPGRGPSHGRDVGWVGRRGSIDREKKLPCLAVQQSARGQETGGRRVSSDGTATVRSAPPIHPSPTLLHPLPVRPSVPLRASPCRAAARAISRAFSPDEPTARTHPTVRSTRFLAWRGGGGLDLRPLIESVHLPFSPPRAREDPISFEARGPARAGPLPPIRSRWLCCHLGRPGRLASRPRASAALGGRALTDHGERRAARRPRAGKCARRTHRLIRRTTPPTDRPTNAHTQAEHRNA